MKRSPLLSNVPTPAELGYKDLVVGAWHGVMAPKGTPAEAVKVLNQQLNEVIRRRNHRGALAGGPRRAERHLAA